MQTKKKLDNNYELPEIIDPRDDDVLSFNERTRAYEIYPKRYSRQFLSHAGFTHDGALWYSHSDKSALRLPEWELIADPETYARLKTQTARV